MMVSLDGVTLAFGERTVITETTLAVAAGSILALVGPSGCGKSTLLKLILGLVAPDRGRVSVGEVEVTPTSARAVRRRMGYVLQDGGLFPHMTARENATLVPRLDHWESTRISRRLDELADLTRLSSALLDRHPRQLSGGERQRVALVRALMLDPDVLLLDEPLGALDPIVRARLQEDLRAMFRALGKCVILVTHDMPEAAYLAESIAVMRAGTIVQRGTLRALRDAPADPFVTEMLDAHRSLPA